MLQKSYILFFMVLVFIHCQPNTAPKQSTIDITKSAAVETTQGIATSYRIDSKQSLLYWSGAALGKKHSGTVQFSSGRLNLVDGNITSGDVDLDIQNLSVSDLKAEAKMELESHLKESDFFETNKFPLGRFVITKVESIAAQNDFSHKVTGELTLKNVTKTVSFLAKIQMTADKISATSQEFSINRTAWGINYNSGVLGVAVNKAIKDEILIKIQLFADKNS